MPNNLLTTIAPKIQSRFAYLIISLCFWFALFQDKFSGLLTARTYTGWDTHSYGFVYFLYFSDALKSGSIPLWNPFVQSGNFFPNFFNVGLFYPFELLFIFLGWLIGPLLSYELMVQVVIVIGGLGTFFLFSHWKTKEYLAFIGALLYAIIILSPLVGQVWYTVSFSSLPWLLLTCSYLAQSKNTVRPLIWMGWAMLYLFFMVGGYFWLNLMNLLLAFCFSSLLLWSRDQGQARLSQIRVFFRTLLLKPPILFLIFVATVYACVVLPCLINIQFNYSQFFGDFVSPDGRLRGLKVYGAAGYGGALETLIGNIDPLISQNQPWWKEGAFNYGAGWTLWIALLVALSLQWTRRQIFWLIAMTLLIVYSAGSETLLGSIVMRIPIVNGNRYWLGVGTSYASVFLLFLVINKLELIAQGFADHRILLKRIGLVFVAVCSFLFLLYAPKVEYAIVCISCICLAIFCLYRLKPEGKIALLGIAFLSAFYVLYIPYRAYSNPVLLPTYLEVIANRKQEANTTENHRKLDPGSEYNYYDTEWLYQKIPFAHGYNHLGNPRYWYVKNNPILDKIVVVTQAARADGGIQRSKLKTDNEYAQQLGGDVLSQPGIPAIEAGRFVPIKSSSGFTYELFNLRVNPNSVSFEVLVNDPAHIILNMLYAPGWRLLVNGVAQKPYQANYLFQGFDVSAAGKYQFQFTYRPYAQILLLGVPYIVLLVLMLGLALKRPFNRKS
jgi:hypothetical protein